MIWVQSIRPPASLSWACRRNWWTTLENRQT